MWWYKKMVKIKKRLTQHEEFEIMKLVLDKFLWLGFGVMALGLYQIYKAGFSSGLGWIISGAVILILFVVLMLREYERSK